MGKFKKAKSLYSATANSFGTGEGVTITPSSVSGLPTDAEITLTFDRQVEGKLERITGTVVGSNFVVSSGGRGADGTTEQSHTSPTVEHIVNGSDINDMVDGILVDHNQDGKHTQVSLVSSSAPAPTTEGVVKYDSDDDKIKYGDGSNTRAVVTEDQSATMTNKRVTPRVSTETSSATPTINTDNVDAHSITALAAAITSMTTNLSGTPTNFQKLIIRIKDDGTARAITWGASFASRGATLPTTTVLSKTTSVGLIWNSVTSTWDCVAVSTEA